MKKDLKTIAKEALNEAKNRNKNKNDTVIGKKKELPPIFDLSI
jgi:hypothetical protein